MYHWQNREKKLKAKKQKIPKHGKAFGEIYANAVRKKLKKKNEKI